MFYRGFVVMQELPELLSFSQNVLLIIGVLIRVGPVKLALINNHGTSWEILEDLRPELETPSKHF